MLVGTPGGVEIGSAIAGVPFERGGAMAVTTHLAQS